MLVLLPTDHNNLLMQWKGPFEVSAVVGLNDYKVRVKGKERVYHANLLKKYFEREDSVSVGAVALEVNANICENEHVEKLILWIVLIFWRLVVMLLKSQSMDSIMWPSEITFLMSKDQSLWTLQMGFKACLQKLQAQHVWLSIISSLHLTYPVPYSLKESMKDITDMIKMAVIRESSSPYASPVVVVKKKDNTNRVCVDYRRLDKLTAFDPEPMPTAEHLFQKLNGDKYFTRIDLSKGYWQISIPEEDIPKTALSRLTDHTNS